MSKSGPPLELFPSENEVQAEKFIAAAKKRASKLKVTRTGKVIDITKRFTFTRPQVQKARTGMESRAKSGDWTGASPMMLVALYERLHKIVYEIDAGDLSLREWASASNAASRLLANEFAGDYPAIVTFMHWTWKREEGREAWRRQNKCGNSHLGWRQQFYPGHQLTDFRIAQARRCSVR